MLLSYSINHIDMEIRLEGHHGFRFTGFVWGASTEFKKIVMGVNEAAKWGSVLPWCLMGDLNNILSQSEKKGGRPYPQWLISGFQETCYECNLRDLDLVGYPYTWEKGKGTSSSVEVRLDRALITQPWSELFPEAILENMEVTASDHYPLWLNLGVRKERRGTMRFRFENAWTREPMCKQVVRDSWGGVMVCSLRDKIKCCSTALAEWGQDLTGSFKERIAGCRRILKRLRNCIDAGSVTRYKEVQAEFFEVLAQKEIFWKQRSKEMWLKSGDQNTRYFHACVKSRKKKN